MVILLTASVLAGASRDQSLQDMVAQADAARVEDQPNLYMRIVERQLKTVDNLYYEGKVDQGNEAVRDIVTFSDKAQNAAIKSHKKVKNTEIALRKTAAKLRDIRHTLTLDEQPPVQEAAEHLEKLRSDLLAHLFGANE
jgi:hypothetical protein